jgi:site-specific DNA-methyltransferase (adenine-specific)
MGTNPTSPDRPPPEVFVNAPVFDLSVLDAVEWLRRLPDESVDLLVTDPAYESLEKHRAIGTTTRLKHSKSSSNNWFNVFPNARFGELFAEVFRVLRRNTHFYLFCDAETMFVAKPAAEQAGFRFWKPLVWDKCTIGMGYHYRAR